MTDEQLDTDGVWRPSMPLPYDAEGERGPFPRVLRRQIHRVTHPAIAVLEGALRGVCRLHDRLSPDDVATQVTATTRTRP